MGLCRSRYTREARLVSSMVSDVSVWQTVEVADMKLKSCSGWAGNQTFEVTADNAPTLFLHVFQKNLRQDDIFMSRVIAAKDLFSGAGLSPRRVGDAIDGRYLDLSGGRPIHSVGEETLEIARTQVDDVGRLLARIHRLDTSWFDEIRERLCERRPLLRGVPHGHHIWYYTSRWRDFLSLPDKAMRKWIAAGPKPTCPAATRVVTCHGDFHPCNILQCQDGLEVIDLEFSCVTYAVQDLAYAFSLWCRSAEHRKAFARSYLIEMGLSAESEDVFALVLDAERCVISYGHFLWPFGLSQSVQRHKSDDNLGRAYEHGIKIASEALSDHTIAEAIVEDGMLAVFVKTWKA